MLALVLSACVPPTPHPVTETGNPERILGLAAFDPTPPAAAANEVLTAWVGLGGTKFILDEEYAGENELEWETPELVADLAAGPVDLKFRSPSLGYSHVEVRPRTGRHTPAEAPVALEDASFVVDGTVSDGRPFRIVSTTEDILSLEHPFSLSDTQSDLALGCDLDVWLEGLDLEGLPGDTVTIDEDHAPALLRTFEQNLARSFTLVEDADGDGAVGEDDPVLVPLD